MVIAGSDAPPILQPANIISIRLRCLSHFTVFLRYFRSGIRERSLLSFGVSGNLSAS